MKEKILAKLNSLIDEAEALLLDAENFKNAPDYGDLSDDYDQSNQVRFYTFRISSLSFLESLVENDSLYFNDFKNNVTNMETFHIKYSIALLTKIKQDVIDGWLLDFKALLSAEIFNNFLDMAEHLLDEKFKDAAAVIIGSVLEENLRQVCLKNSIPIDYHDNRKNKSVPKQASFMNDDLYKHKIYNQNMHKAVVSYLAIRNSAAHGKYNEYDLNQVKHLVLSVRDFAARYLS